MAFEILNEADSVLYILAGDNRYPQAEPDKVDFDILAQGIDGEGVVSGCVVTPQGVPDMTVAVAAGVVRIAGTDVAFAGGNVNCGAAAVGFPRFDLIAIDNAGVASAVAGVAAGPPVFPAVPANSVIVAAVWRAANDNTITAADIVDKRCLLLGDALGTAPTLIGIVGGIATPNRSHHTLSAQAGAADDLDGLAVSSIITNGEIVIIRPDAGDTITVKHNALGGADARNILCIGNADIVCDDDHDFVICIYASAIGAGSWMALQGGAGGGFALANKGELHGYAAADAAVAAAPADNQVLQSDAADAEGLTWRATPRLASISDTGGAAPRIKFAAASPHVEVDDNLRAEQIGVGVNPAASVLIAASYTSLPAGGSFSGLRLEGVGTFNVNNAIGVGVNAAPTFTLGAGLTGVSVYGLDFQGFVTGGGGAATVADLMSIRVRIGAIGFTGAIATLAGIQMRSSFFVASSPTITDTLGIDIEDLFATGGTQTNVYGIRIAALTTGTNRYGIHIGDLAGGTIARILELGPTPYLRLYGSGEWTPAANQTPLDLAEGAAPTRRNVRWMDPGVAGANFAGGERVMILV